MDQLLRQAADPVFWWWEEDGGARVLLLSGDTLVLSGPLDGPQITNLEAARQRGDVLNGDFGDGALWVETGAIREMRYVRSERRLQLLREGGVDSIQPPATAGGVAAGAFEVLRDRLAPDSAVQEVAQSAASGRSIYEIPLLAGLTVLTLVVMGLGFGAEQDAVVTGPFTWIRQPVNGIFATVGLLPAAVGGALVAVALLARGVRWARAKRTRPGATVRVLTVGGIDLQAQAESILQSADSFERPLLGPADDAYGDDGLDSLIPVPAAVAEPESELVLESEPPSHMEPAERALVFAAAARRSDPVEMTEPDTRLSSVGPDFDFVLPEVDLPAPPPPETLSAEQVVEDPAPYVPLPVAVRAEPPSLPAETPAAFAEIFDREPPRPAWASTTDN